MTEAQKEYHRQWHRRNKIAIAARRKIARATPKHKAQAAKYQHERRKRPGVKERDYAAQRKWMYGISFEEQKQLLIDQKGLCACCGIDITGKEADGRRAAQLDHCHVTNRIRSYLCRACNLALGCVQDSKENLQKLIEYLKKVQQ